MVITKPACSLVLLLSISSLSAQVTEEGEQSAAKPLEVEMAVSYEGLTNGFADWLGLSVEALKGLDARTSLYATVRQTDRFSLKDHDVTGGIHYPLESNWAVLVEGSVSPSHQVLPRWSVLTQLERSFEIGWVVYAGLRHTEYPAATTNSGIATVETYWGSNRGSYALYINQLVGGGTSTSHVLQASYYYLDFNSLSLVFAIGRELENIQPRGVLSLHVRSLGLFGRHWFADRWAVSYEIGVHEQGDLYTKRGIRVGLRHLF